jgi:hypothetical protein
MQMQAGGSGPCRSTINIKREREEVAQKIRRRNRGRRQSAVSRRSCEESGNIENGAGH